MSVPTARLPDLIQAVAAVIQENADEVAVLDQAIGDGDHVINLQRGLAALSQLAGGLGELDWSAALQKIGMSLMSTVGGASGSLYGTFFLSMSKSLKGKELDTASFAEAFGAGVESIKLRGKAHLGEKTMLDTLIPVADALHEAAAQSLPFPQLVEAVNRAAAAGAESTRDMLATKGRASFLGERAKGYLDPGAKTSQLMIGAIIRVLLA